MKGGNMVASDVNRAGRHGLCLGREQWVGSSAQRHMNVVDNDVYWVTVRLNLCYKWLREMSCILILCWRRKAPKAHLQNIHCEFTSVQNKEFNNHMYSGCKSKSWLLKLYLKVQFNNNTKFPFLKPSWKRADADVSILSILISDNSLPEN